MSKFKELKQKLKDNKYKIIMGTITIAGVAYVIYKQNGKISDMKIEMKELQETIVEKDVIITSNQGMILNQGMTISEQQKDIDILKHVMNGTVLNSLREATKRQLRYAEGRLANGLKSGTISSTDEQLRREEVEYFSKELEKIFEAEKLLTKGD